MIVAKNVVVENHAKQLVKPLMHVMTVTALSLSMMLSGCSKKPDATENASAAASAPASTTSSAPLVIGYSDWPGFVAWQVAIEKGWLKDAGLNVQFQWFDYSASLSAFAAGKLDAVLVTNGDDLVNASAGSRGIMVFATDYSSGNDMIVAKPGINKLADLKGKTVAVEKGLVDHLLLATALKENKIPANSIQLLNSPTNGLPQVLASGKVDAVALWQPVAGQALKAVTGSKAIFTSADQPGLIYDVLSVSPSSLSQHRDDWIKLSKVWDKLVAYINDPATQADAVKIMAARSGVDPAVYITYLKGTHLLDIAHNKNIMVKKDGFESLYGSTSYVNQFNLDNSIYSKDKAPNIDSLIDPQLVQGN